MSVMYVIVVAGLLSYAPVMWSETVGLRKTPVWDQKNRSWSWSWIHSVLETSLLCRSTVAFTCLKVKFVKCLCLLPVVLVLRIWSCLHHWTMHNTVTGCSDWLLAAKVCMPPASSVVVLSYRQSRLDMTLMKMIMQWCSGEWQSVREIDRNCVDHDSLLLLVLVDPVTRGVMSVSKDSGSAAAAAALSPLTGTDPTFISCLSSVSNRLSCRSPSPPPTRNWARYGVDNCCRSVRREWSRRHRVMHSQCRSCTSNRCGYNSHPKTSHSRWNSETHNVGQSWRWRRSNQISQFTCRVATVMCIASSTCLLSASPYSSRSNSNTP